MSNSTTWRIAPTSAPLAPKVRALPFIGSSLNLRENAIGHVLELYHQYGSVFQMRMGFQDYTVLAGYEANRFLSGDANDVVSSERLFGQFGRDMGSDILIVALDGEPQKHMRRLLREGYSRSAIVQHMQSVVNVAHEEARNWRSGDTIPVLNTMRRVVVAQIGLIAMNHSAHDYFDDIRIFLQTLMNVHVMKLWHPIMLHRPKHRQAYARLLELGRAVKQYHETHPVGTDNRPANLFDDILAGHRPDGQPFTEGDLVMLIIGSFFAGMDTLANTASFFLYAIAKHPDVQERIVAELDEKLPDPTNYQAYRSLDILHATAMEVLRRYPIAPFSPRTATQEFEFAGYRIPEGTELMFAQTLTHFLPEYFEDPHTFNIDRFIDKKPAPFTYTPYTLGAHTCLGAGLAEVLLMVNIATLLKRYRFELTHPDYVVPIYTAPTPNPGEAFRIRVKDARA
jgi:cytochrome P450